MVEQPAEDLPADQVFERALFTARELGYRAYEVDEKRRYANFVAKSGEVSTNWTWGASVMVAESNYLMMSVLDDGSVKVWATGPGVRGDKIDKWLAQEADIFATRVAGYEVVFE